ncbi:serine/threonine protein kinase [Sorangium sp. So ce887]|uniref:serine/threonine protein kinase n=1 Tax=Sorangium sp. So ce887 TaxID=3133324 RepID=UPI003F5FBA6C
MVAKGEIWEGHELVNELARGMVRTFLARQLGDTRELVWLHVREGARIERDVFAAEIERLQRLADEVPQVARVLYGGVSGTVAWAATPFLKDAIRLRDATRAADLGLTAVRMLIELGQSLVRAHELGAIHGALSPERVLIAAENGYAFTHFGFVRLFQLAEEEALREPCHAAPELIFGGRLGKRTDVYGFGTVMYELLCQRELYADEEHRTLSEKTWEPRFPITVPPVLRCVMKKALAKEPRDRYPSVEQMLTVLAAIADEWAELGRAPAGLDDAAATGSPAGRPVAAEEAWEPFARDEEAPMAAPVPVGTPSLDGVLEDDTAPIEVPSLDLPSRQARDLAKLAPSPPRISELPLPVRSSEDTGTRVAVRWLGAVLVLGAALGAGSAMPRRQRPPEAVARLAQVVQPAALRSGAPCPLTPAGALQEAQAAASPVAPRSLANGQAAVAREAAKRRPSPQAEHCDGIYAGYLCGHDNY